MACGVEYPGTKLDTVIIAVVRGCVHRFSSPICLRLLRSVTVNMGLNEASSAEAGGSRSLEHSAGQQSLE